METVNRLYFLILIFIFISSCSCNYDTGNDRERNFVETNIKENVFTNSQKYNYLYWWYRYTSQVSFYYYTPLNIAQDNQFEPFLFLKAFKEYKSKFLISSAEYLEDSYEEFRTLFYESSSSYNLYAYFSAFMIESYRRGFSSEGVGYNIARMFIKFPDKFYEMYQYTELLDKEDQCLIWRFVLTSCAWELLLLVDTGIELEPQSLIKDTTIYKDLYPTLYDNFGSSAWKYVVMEAKNGQKFSMYTQYLDYLRLKFYESIDNRIN